MKTAENLLSIFQKIIQNQKLSHIYLIEGGDYFTQKKFLYDLAELFFKNTVITSCSKKIIQINNYPNFYYLSSHNDLIKKEQILAMKQHFHHTSLLNAKKMYAIYKAEYISVKAANSLLNFLENPVNNNILGILFTNNARLLLPTILSRVQIFHLISTNSSTLTKDTKQIVEPLDQVFFNLLKKQYSNLSTDILSTAYYISLKKFFLAFCQWEHVSFEFAMELWIQNKDFMNHKTFIDDFLNFLLAFCLDLYKYRYQSLDLVFPMDLFEKTWLIKLSEHHFQFLLNLLIKIEKQKSMITIPFCFMGFLIEMVHAFKC